MSLVNFPTPEKRKRVFTAIAALSFAVLIAVGVFAKNGWFPSTDSFTGKKTGWFGSLFPGMHRAIGTRSPHPFRRRPHN